MSARSDQLRCEGVSVHFGGFRALGDVSLEFETGKVTALIGPNGAGKTTLMNVLTGLQRPTSGRVWLGTRDLKPFDSSGRARLGLARSFQIISIYPTLTVLENVRLGMMAPASSHRFFWQDISADVGAAQRAVAHLARFGLETHASRTAGELSHGEQRKLELAMSLVGDPSVVLLDEPLAGVGHGEADSLLEFISSAIKGRTTVLVEHNMDAVMELSDSVVCLVSGSVLAQGTPDQVRADSSVRQAYLGD